MEAIPTLTLIKPLGVLFGREELFAIILRGVPDHPIEVGESAVALRIRNIKPVGYGGRWNS